MELTYRGTLSKRMKRANQAHAAAAIILGDDEMDRGIATVRDLDSGARSKRRSPSSARISPATRPTDERATGFEERLDRVLDRHRELGDALSAVPPPPRAELAQLSREYTQLSPIVDAITALRAARDEARDLQAMADDPESEPEMRALAEAERTELSGGDARKGRGAKLLLLPADEADERNAILEIRAGTGGEEAALFAGDLLRMYQRYVEGRAGVSS